MGEGLILFTFYLQRLQQYLVCRSCSGNIGWTNEPQCPGPRVDTLIFTEMNCKWSWLKWGSLPASFPTPSSLLSSVCSFLQTRGYTKCLRSSWMKTAKLINWRKWVLGNQLASRGRSRDPQGNPRPLAGLQSSRGDRLADGGGEVSLWRTWTKTGQRSSTLENTVSYKKSQS